MCKFDTLQRTNMALTPLPDGTVKESEIHVSAYKMCKALLIM